MRTQRDLLDGEKIAAGDSCASVSGTVLDRAVAEAVLARLAPPRVEAVREVWKEAAKAEGDERSRRDAQLTAARREVEAAKRRALAVDREPCPEVASELDQIRESAKDELRRLEKTVVLPVSALSLFTEESWSELLALCADLRSIWEGPTTKVRDRKELIRTIVRAVIVDGRSEAAVTGHIEWQDATPDKPFEFASPARARDAVIALHEQDLRAREIADRLNQQGLRTVQGNPWTADSVMKKVSELRRKGSLRKD